MADSLYVVFQWSVRPKDGSKCDDNLAAIVESVWFDTAETLSLTR